MFQTHGFLGSTPSEGTKIKKDYNMFDDIINSIEHTGFCLGKFEKSCLTECPLYIKCLELYEKENERRIIICLD